MDATVGIVTRTKNRPVLLKRALESVTNQTFTDWIMVIVNDGGDREPVEALVQVYRHQSGGKIQLIHNDRSQGKEAAANQGIRSIKTKFIAIHDDDDSWAPEYLTVSVSELNLAHDKFPRVAASISKANAVYEKVDGNIVKIDRMEVYNPWLNHGFVPLGLVLEGSQFATIQLLFRYDAGEQIGFFREDLPALGDWDFAIRFISRFDIYTVPQVLAFIHFRMADKSPYGNSTIAFGDVRDKYAQLLKNEWLRRDLDEKAFGIGVFMNLHSTMRDLQYELKATRVACGKTPAHPVAAPNKPHVGGGRPVTNTIRMIRYWLRSGRQFHYVKQALRTLRSEGPGAVVRKIKLWLALRQGR